MSVKRLIKHVRSIEAAFPHVERTAFPKEMSLYLFDELYTSKFNGFLNADDYYHKSSSMPLLHKIGVKTMIVSSKDDPIIAHEPFLNAKLSDKVRLALTERGGHTGFWGPGDRGETFWIDSLLLRFIEQIGEPWPSS